jgi:hypothetical protein
MEKVNDGIDAVVMPRGKSLRRTLAEIIHLLSTSYLYT